MPAWFLATDYADCADLKQPHENYYRTPRDAFYAGICVLAGFYQDNQIALHSSGWYSHSRMEIKATFLFFVIAFCFSCSHLPQIEKRHYRDGFYINKKKENKPVAVKQESTFHPIQIPVAGIKTQEIRDTSRKLPVLSVQENVVEIKKNFLPEKITPEIQPISIDPPKEPFNKKARTAQVFFILARLMLIAAFIVSLFSLLGTVFIVAGIAALFALLALLFAIWARKELAAQPPYERELGDKEAKQVIQRALAGIGSAVFIVLLALLIEWIKRQ
jgi:hypothetical protein